MELKDDPRADPRMLAAMEPFGLSSNMPSPVDSTSSAEDLHGYISAAEEGFEGLFGLMFSSLPEVEGVTRTVEVIKGVDGNDITLFIHRPTAAIGAMPGVLHIHGGGMVLMEAAGIGYRHWRDGLAASGMVVVGVEFRNGGGKLGPHPFPAGLNDCSSALHWVTANKAALGISKLIVSGESGGGNLTIATTLKAKRDGHLAMVDGVYAQCPYISGAYARQPVELASLFENDGYFLSCAGMGAMVKVYDPLEQNVTNPLAWPYHASTDDLAGLPPHVISVNELDPLRDEGLAFFRKLLAAGVSAISRTVNGTCHAGDVVFCGAMPEVSLSTIRDISSFAHSL
jgi:acetyl esterase